MEAAKEVIDSTDLSHLNQSLLSIVQDLGHPEKSGMSLIEDDREKTLKMYSDINANYTAIHGFPEQMAAHANQRLQELSKLDLLDKNERAAAASIEAAVVGDHLQFRLKKHSGPG